jgi:hypothetical protein
MYLEGDSVALVESRPQYPMSLFLETARARVGGALGAWLPQDIMKWTGQRPRFLSSANLEWVARELATTPSVAVRQCYQGELDGCRRALGLTGEGEHWDLWYSAPERRELVRSGFSNRAGPPSSDPRDLALWHGCVELQDMRDCDLFLADRKPRAPLTASSRESLLALSLRMGGAGSFERLRLAPPGPLEERLARAAGVPPDSLLASWRREALQAQPSAWAGLAKTPVAALFWFLLFGILAARSTRWRLG